jgi:hypothetical protein
MAELNDVDRGALERCVQLVLAVGDDFAEMVRAKLREEPWQRVAKFCCFGLQMSNLGLRPWQSPPCDGEDERDPQTKEMADRLRNAGLSVYEPSPLQALAAAEKAKRRP